MPDSLTRAQNGSYIESNGDTCPLSVVGGRISRVVANATFDPISPAGAMHDYFRGNPEKKHPLEFLSVREAIRPEYRDHDARLAVMDKQGVSKIWLFPTLCRQPEKILGYPYPYATHSAVWHRTMLI